jgi:hypothetical protein
MSEEENERVRKAQALTRPVAERIEQGTAYHEPVTVWFTDKKEHAVEVYALSSKQFREAARKAGVAPGNLGNPEKLLDNLDFVAAIAEAATKDPTITERLLSVNEDGKIASKAFELMQPPKNSRPS